jgi:hypothetical protein
MVTTSERSIRIQGLSTSDYNSICAQWREATEKASNRSPPSSGTALSTGSSKSKFQSSLATRDGHNTATVTFENKKAKAEGLRAILSMHLDRTGWKIDDVFDGLTILHSLESAENTEIEYGYSPF